MKMRGRTVIVTGASRGIGRSVAQRFDEEGARVALVSRSENGLLETASRIDKAKGVCLAIPTDITDPEAAAASVEKIEKELGPVDILVNNAGVNIRERRWAELNPARIDTVVDGNLSSAFYVSAAVLPLMRAQKDGVLIHTASWAGRYISPMSGPAYTAAKHAVVAMSHTINIEEFDNGIRSSVICPGEVATPILDHRPVPVSAEDRARMLQAEDLGDLILFVATRPKRVCINEVLIGPAWNRSYLRMRG